MTTSWPRWCLKSPASPVFTQPFIQTQIKENIKAPRHWPLCGDFTGTGEFPAQRASYAENVSIWWRHNDSYLCGNLSAVTSSVFLDDMYNIEIETRIYYQQKYESTKSTCTINHYIGAETKWKPFRIRVFKCVCRTRMFESLLNFHWSLFQRVQLTIFQHWCR